MKKLGLIILVIFYVVPNLYGQEANQMIIVEVKKGDTLRKIAEKYLGDANSWPEILRINRFEDPDDIKVGDRVRLVANSAVLARKALVDAQESLSNAVEAGASIYAANPLKESENLLAQALKALKEDKFPTVRLFSLQAKEKADFALQLSEKVTVKSVHANFTDLAGDVETKKDEDLLWSGAELGMNLSKGQKVRTFTKSRADVTFTNDDLMRIGENSLAVIGDMQVDIRKKVNKSSVVLLQGDIAAQLKQLKSSDEFEMKTDTGVAMDVKSQDFYVDVEKESKVTRVAVFDEGGKIDVSSAGSKVTVGANQGTKIEPNKQPEAPRNLLLPPILLSPKSKTRFSRNEVTLKWKPLKDAEIYWLEISKNPNFENLVITEPNLKKSEFTVFLREGKYYWRVKAVDEEKFPSAFSPSYNFEILFDRTPPSLRVDSPKDGQILLSENLVVKGYVEPQSKLTINGEKVLPSTDGNFYHEMEITEQDRKISISALDSVGNQVKVERNIVLNTVAPKIEITSRSPELTNQENFPISGRALNADKIMINNKDVNLDSDGHFNTTIKLVQGNNTLHLMASDIFGRKDAKNFNIVLDTESPELNFRKSINREISRDEKINFTGTVKDADIFMINEEEIVLKGDRFNIDFDLQEGKNSFVLKATDRAGNETLREVILTKDSEAPELHSHSISPNPVTTQQKVELTISAEDKGVGARKTLEFAIRGENNFYYEGILEKGNNTSVYSGSIQIPQNVKGMLQFDYILLEDYLGNSKKYEF